MNTVQNYKCPCCGASLLFKGEKLHCEACGNEFPLEALRQTDEIAAVVGEESKLEWEHYEPQDLALEKEVLLSGYSCPSCGAEITGDDTLGATVCPYCGNATVIKKQFEGAFHPDCIIPFKVDKKAAMAAFEADFENAPFLPDEFKNKKKIEEMSGVYVPFWLFDCDCNAAISYNAELVTSRTARDYNYTKTSFFKLYRGGSVSFANIPVNASKKADNAYMEAVEPFDCKDAAEFNCAYLAGYLADKYDISAEESTSRANERVKNSTVAAFQETVNGYTAAVPEKTRLDVSNGKIRYSLMPVWMLNIRYEDKNYKFAINGQTGKVVGAYPVDKRKKKRYFTKIAVCAYAAAAVVAYCLLH